MVQLGLHDEVAQLYEQVKHLLIVIVQSIHIV